jgi:hypothetical protein
MNSFISSLGVLLACNHCNKAFAGETMLSERTCRRSFAKEYGKMPFEARAKHLCKIEQSLAKQCSPNAASQRRGALWKSSNEANLGE